MAGNIYDSDDDGSIDGSSSSDTIFGGVSSGTLDGGMTPNDTIDGGQSDDTIFGGEGDDLLFGGDAGDAAGGGTANAKTVDSFQFDVAKATTVSTGTGPGHIGDSITYNDIATADDGTAISVRITVTDQTDPDLEVILGYNDDYGIIVNSNNDKSMMGEKIDLKIEFLDPDGDPVTIDSNFTFRDIDNNGSWGNEGITFDTTDITSYAVSNDPSTDIVVDDRGDEIEFTSSRSGSVNNENLWTQVFFEGQSSLSFTLESRAHNAGYGFNTADFDQPPVITEVDASGDDLLYGGAGNDSALGGGGNDTIHGDEGDDTLDGNKGDDTLFGGDGDDTLLGSEGADTLSGGGGQDFADYSGSDSGVSVDLSTGSASGGQADGDQLTGIDGIVGSDHADTLTGFDGQATGANAYTNIFYGGDGDDVLDGRGGDDTLYGGNDADSVIGGDDNDALYGDAGADTLSGGAGNDFVDGGTGSDTIDAGSGNDSVLGGEGSDSIDANDGDDIVSGGAGADTIHAGDGADELDGGTGADTIFGGAGNDTLSGGDGANSLYGGAGDDLFTFDEASTGDLVSGGDGMDVLDASGASAGLTVTLDQTATIAGGGNNTTFEGIEKLVLSDYDDTVSGGGTEPITIDAGAGSDQIAGTDGDDMLDGGSDNDTLDAGAGSDTLSGGDGADVFVVRSADFSDLGTADEIKAAIIDMNASGIEGWQAAKGDTTPDENSPIALEKALNEGDIADAVEDTLKSAIGNSAAKDAKDLLQDTLKDYFDENKDEAISAKDVSDLTYQTLKPEIGWFNAGRAAITAYGEAKDQIEAAKDDETAGSVDDVDVDALVTDVTEALYTKIEITEADALAPDLRDAVQAVLDNATGGTVTTDELATAIHDTVEPLHGGGKADFAADTAIDSLTQQFTAPSESTPTITDDILARATHDVIDDFQIGEDSLDLSNIDYLGGQGLSTNDVGITDTAGDGTGAAVLNLPDGSTITLSGVSVYDLDPETLETMGFDASPDATGFQNAFLTEAGQIGGGGGDDAITGSAAAETISGGSGADTLIAGGGADSISGGDDRDRIVLSDDLAGISIDGGEGGDDFDTLDFSDLTIGVKVVSTGEEAGTFEANSSSTAQSTPPPDPNGLPMSTASSGAPPPSTFAAIESFSGSGNDDAFDFTAHGNEVDIDGLAGDDSISGSAFNDALDGGSGNDTIFGGQGNDTIVAGSENDVASGGAGNDSISGGAGTDTVTGGLGDDQMDGGSGNDMFVLSDGGGDDTVTDFAAGDQIDTAALDDGGGGMVTADEVVVTGGGGSDQILTFPSGETLTVPDGTVDASSPSAQFASLVAMGVPPCFAPGTLIRTPDGDRAVETLAVGDLVATADHGPRRIRWIGRREQVISGRDDDAHIPIRIGAGTLGSGLPARDLIVSPQHRMMLSGQDVQSMFETRDVLAPAKALTKFQGVRPMRGKRKVTYIALLFDRHEVIFAESAPTESFRPGPTAMQGFASKVKQDIYRIYPDLLDDPQTGLGPPARRLLTRKEARALARDRAARPAESS